MAQHSRGDCPATRLKKVLLGEQRLVCSLPAATPTGARAWQVCFLTAQQDLERGKPKATGVSDIAYW